MVLCEDCRQRLAHLQPTFQFLLQSSAPVPASKREAMALLRVYESMGDIADVDRGSSP